MATKAKQPAARKSPAKRRTPTATKRTGKPVQRGATGGPRSAQWFGRDDIYGFIYRSWTKNRGIPHDQFDGRPVIGICNTYSELTPCNSHFRTIAEHVKAGVLEAGGFPLEFPVMSLGEALMRPPAMLYRNRPSMDVAQSNRDHPLERGGPPVARGTLISLTSRARGRTSR